MKLLKLVNLNSLLKVTSQSVYNKCKRVGGNDRKMQTTKRCVHQQKYEDYGEEGVRWHYEIFEDYRNASLGVERERRDNLEARKLSRSGEVRHLLPFHHNADFNSVAEALRVKHPTYQPLTEQLGFKTPPFL